MGVDPLGKERLLEGLELDLNLDHLENRIGFLAFLVFTLQVEQVLEQLHTLLDIVDVLLLQETVKDFRENLQRS